MKVILLGATPPPVGGIAQWTVRMLNSKLKNNWELDLIDEKIIGGRECFGSNIKKNYYFEAKRWLNVWHSLHIKLKNPEAKVVHACPIATRTSMLAEYVSALITKIHKKKFIVHFRCTVPNMINGRFDKWLLRKLCNASDAIISLNNQTRNYLQEITETYINVIPNFVDISEISTEKCINKELKTAVYVGGVIKEKGCDEILNLAKHYPDIEFRLVGRASEEIKEKAIEMTNVFLTGIKEKKEVKQELENADVFLFLSRYSGEGFSNALAEAMAAGLPCIVTDWAANADMIDNNYGGFVIDSLEQAVEAIKALYSDEVRKQQSEYNKRKVIDKYSAKNILDQYVDIYEISLK